MIDSVVNELPAESTTRSSEDVVVTNFDEEEKAREKRKKILKNLAIAVPIVAGLGWLYLRGKKDDGSIAPSQEELTSATKDMFKNLISAVNPPVREDISNIASKLVQEKQEVNALVDDIKEKVPKLQDKWFMRLANVFPAFLEAELRKHMTPEQINVYLAQKRSANPIGKLIDKILLTMIVNAERSKKRMSEGLQRLKRELSRGL